MPLNMTFSRSDEFGETITVYFPGKGAKTAGGTHPHFDKIVEKAMAGDASALDLFDLALTAGTKFEQLTERISVAYGRVFFDGEEQDNALTQQISRFIEEDVDDWQPLVNFYDNVQQNPNEHSREHLYRWLTQQDAEGGFTITPDGMIVGYKSVNSTVNEGVFESINKGTAIVNGEVIEGKIPNEIGSVVEMPRNEVAFDPAVGCHTGLHVGTYNYAATFSGDSMLEVHVNPRDVVSVPTESNSQKMRVCRYLVAGVIVNQYDTALSEDYEGDELELSDEEMIALAAELNTTLKTLNDLAPKPKKAPRVKKDEVFEDTDKRRAGRKLKVVKVLKADGVAVVESLDTGKVTKVALNRLNSRKYRRVN